MTHRLISSTGACRRVRRNSVALLITLAVTPVSAFDDPTRPPDFRSAPADVAPQVELSVGSILVGEFRRTAVINGEPRREGQQFEGVRVQRIHPDRVEILEQGRVRVLHLEALPQVRATQ
jgi:MSHA biogenesis protein MshK